MAPSLTSKKTRSSRTAWMPRAMKPTWITRASPGHRPQPGAMYVAKNNNALLATFTSEHNRDFHAVVMFREPLTHAASLRAMHQKYCAMQQDDPFVKTYMDWLAHHEFGLGQKPFKFTDQTPLPQGDRDTLDHWLDLWINHYEAALAMDRHRLHFIGYDGIATAHRSLDGPAQEVGAEVDWDAFSRTPNSARSRATWTLPSWKRLESSTRKCRPCSGADQRARSTRRTTLAVSISTTSMLVKGDPSTSPERTYHWGSSRVPLAPKSTSADPT